MRIWLLAVAIIFVLIQAESDASRAPGDLNGNGKLDFGDFVALSKGIQSSPDLRGRLIAFSQNDELQLQTTIESPGWQVAGVDVGIEFVASSLGLDGQGSSGVVATSTTSLNDLAQVSAELDEGDILKISDERVGGAEIEGEFEFYEGAVVQDLLDEIANAYDGGISLNLDPGGRMVAFDATCVEMEGFEVAIVLLDANGRSRLNSSSKQLGDEPPQFWRVGASGNYRARAVDEFTGVVLGTWGSIPISGGKENSIILPIGKPEINQ